MKKRNVIKNRIAQRTALRKRLRLKKKYIFHQTVTPAESPKGSQ